MMPAEYCEVWAWLGTAAQYAAPPTGRQPGVSHPMGDLQRLDPIRCKDNRAGAAPTHTHRLTHGRADLV